MYPGCKYNHRIHSKNMKINGVISTSYETEDCGKVKLLCNICDLVPLKNPIVTSSGHLYCELCLNKWLQNQQQKHCRKCATPLIYDANFVKIYGNNEDDCKDVIDESDCVFKCRICLEPPPPTNAVATSCGHIFCWPCLYIWLCDDYRPCPVCKNILIKDVNIIPFIGSPEIHFTRVHSSTNVNQAIEVSLDGFFIPELPNPPKDVLALSSRTYSTSDYTRPQLSRWERILLWVLTKVCPENNLD